MRAGDTLQGIAAQLWGDASLWYKLAEANGLGAAAGLADGQALTIPAGVASSKFSASTFRPYDASEAVGDTSPVNPKAPKKNNKCGVFGAIILVAIAVAVAVVTAGAAVAALAPSMGLFGGLAAFVEHRLQLLRLGPARDRGDQRRPRPHRHRHQPARWPDRQALGGRRHRLQAWRRPGSHSRFRPAEAG